MPEPTPAEAALLALYRDRQAAVEQVDVAQVAYDQAVGELQNAQARVRRLDIRIDTQLGRERRTERGRP